MLSVSVEDMRKIKLYLRLSDMKLSDLIGLDMKMLASVLKIVVVNNIDYK